MIKRNDLDFLLIQPKDMETERQMARREAFQQMVQALQNKQTYNPTELIEPTKQINKNVKSKSAAC